MTNEQMTFRARVTGLLLAIGFLAAGALPAEAGCGCAKPPPLPAPLRPNVNYAGAPVTFFSPALMQGVPYIVTFTSSGGTSVAVPGVGEWRRDLADGIYKAQLTVPVPALPLGPAAITVDDLAGGRLLTIGDASFTVAPVPIALISEYGTWQVPATQAAVGRDGTVYLSLDLTAVSRPIVVDAQMFGYPLRFQAANVLFTNTQGFLMQRLVDPASKSTDPIPGMFVYPSDAPLTKSDTLHYSRHEFVTYFLQHQERQPHARDLLDPNWHLDGTRHVDHDHLIVAVTGLLADGSMPSPGPTPAFDLRVTINSLFAQGVVGISKVGISGSAVVDSFDSATRLPGWNGDVFSNGQISLSGSSIVRGTATASKVSRSGTSLVLGQTLTLVTPATFMQVKTPAGITELGEIDVKDTSQTIVGPGSFHARKLKVDDGRLFIDNFAGPVTLYVDEDVVVQGTGMVQVADPKPEKFAVYATGTKSVSLSSASTFTGVIYAPNGPISLSGNAELAGAVVGYQLNMSNQARLHYDSSLRGR